MSTYRHRSGGEVERSDLPAANRIPAEFRNTGFHLGCSHMFLQGPCPLHVHEHEELVIVWDGSGVHLTEAGDCPLEPGHVFLIAKGHEHGYANTRGLLLSNIYFDREALALPTADLESIPGFNALASIGTPASSDNRAGHRPARRLHPRTVGEIERLTGWIAVELREKRPGYRFASLAHLMEILTRVARATDRLQSGQTSGMMIIQRATFFAEAQFHRSLTMEELAEAACTSVRTLQRLFRRELDCTPLEYLHQLRIRKAQFLLRTHPDSVSEVAYRCGFSDANYFARVFRSAVGMSPMEFREALTVGDCGD
jgi:AraC-like DNA-binding protein/mannose-6-phosphate isomerase-like protein (cupin superfamily)